MRFVTGAEVTTRFSEKSGKHYILKLECSPDLEAMQKRGVEGSVPSEEITFIFTPPMAEDLADQIGNAWI